jgi:hypothetical protein
MLRRFAMIPVVLVLCLLPGCTDNGYHGPKVATMLTGGQQPGQNVQLSDDDKYRVFEGCMRDKGVVLSSGPDSGPPSEEMMQKMQDAAEACRDLLPNRGAAPNIDPKVLDEARKQAQCMRDHGVEMRDPTQDQPYVAVNASPSESERKAMEECMGVRSAPGPSQ